MLRDAFTPLEKIRAGVWALLWFLFASLGTFLFWDSVFHHSPFMLFFAAVAVTASRSGGRWGMAVALGAVVENLFRPQVDRNMLWVPVISMLVNSSIIIFLGHALRAGYAERRQEQLFRDSLGDAVADFLWACTPLGKLVYLNDRMRDYFGKTSEELLGEGWKEWIPPEDWKELEALFEKSTRSKEQISLTMRYRNRDGVYRFYLCRAVPMIGENGIISRWVGTGTDIHEQQVAEKMRDEILLREQRARLDAEQASKIKDEFLATLSHELRTPLNAVFGWLQLLRTGESSPEDVREGLEVIDRNVRVQNQLVNDLLDMSSIITGKMRLKVETLNLPELVRLALESVRPAAEAKQITLRSTSHGGTGSFRGDPARLQQIIWNLLHNAVKFTPRGGSVWVDLQWVDGFAELAVKDNGEGMEAEFLPYSFDRFRQADASPTRAHGGLGLGLAITRQLIELHGGTISAKSEGLGLGSTFLIRFPLLPARMETVASSPVINPTPSLAAVSNLEGRRILVVDDDEDTRYLLRQILQSRGIAVSVAGSAREAWEVLDSNAVEHSDAIICDIAMPGMSGYDFIAEVRKMPEESRRTLPALALTAFARQEDRERSLAAGFDMFLSKPVEPVTLLASVSRLVDLRR